MVHKNSVYSSCLVVDMTCSSQTINNQPPVLNLAIRLWYKDLKNLIKIPVHPDFRVCIHKTKNDQLKVTSPLIILYVIFCVLFYFRDNDPGGWMVS